MGCAGGQATPGSHPKGYKATKEIANDTKSKIYKKVNTVYCPLGSKKRGLRSIKG